jgi:hypothetical protein
MGVADVSAWWGIRLRPAYDVSPSCGPADLRGVVTGRGIRIGSTLVELQRAYRRLTSRPNRFFPGSRHYFFRQTAAPHWELGFDVDNTKRVTRIVFGTHDAVHLDEACA